MQSKLMKLRQLAGGFVYHDGEAHRTGNSKLKELYAVLGEIPRPVVIWAEFSEDIKAIEALLEGYCDCSTIQGGTKNTADIVRLFQTGLVPILICQPQACGHGITLTKACYSIYYNLGFSSETYKQSRDRIHRIGQTKPCTYIHLVSRDTCDEQLISVVTGKKDKSEAMLEMLKGGKRGVS